MDFNAYYTHCVVRCQQSLADRFLFWSVFLQFSVHTQAGENVNRLRYSTPGWHGCSSTHYRSVDRQRDNRFTCFLITQFPNRSLLLHLRAIYPHLKNNTSDSLGKLDLVLCRKKAPIFNFAQFADHFRFDSSSLVFVLSPQVCERITILFPATVCWTPPECFYRLLVT